MKYILTILFIISVCSVAKGQGSTAGSNRSLSNILNPAVNSPLTPGTDNVIDFDTNVKRFVNAWFAGTVTSVTFTTSGSNGGLTCNEGTGGSLTPSTSIDALWCDSTGQRFAMNNHATGKVYMIGVAAAGTPNDCYKIGSNGYDPVDTGAGCGGLSGLTTNVVLKAMSSTFAENSSITDNGTNVSTAEPVQAGTGTTALFTTQGANQNVIVGSGNGSGIDGGTGTATIENPLVSGTISTTAGIPVILASLDQTGVSTANSGSAQNVLASTPQAGHYQLRYYVDQSAGCTTLGSGALTISAGWTDATHARVTSNQTLTVATADTGTGDFLTNTLDFWAAASSAITVTATYTACTTGTWTYDLHALVTEMK